MFNNSATAVVEFKFASDAQPGEFSGYGAVFDTQDEHKDLIKPGAFAASLIERKSAGRGLPMYVEHGPYVGGDHLPVGVWNTVEEDSHGLKVSGKIINLDTDHGKRIHGLVKSGAIGGLSIEYAVPPGGATMGRNAGEPKRTLSTLNLKGISLVADPSNAGARVASIKSAMGQADRTKATDAVAAAMRLHDKAMTGDSYSGGSSKDKGVLMNHLRDAHEALTGQRAPDGMEGWKASSTIREFEELLRERGFSHTEAKHIAEHGFKSLPRDEVADQAISPSVASALDAFRAAAGL